MRLKQIVDQLRSQGLPVVAFGEDRKKFSVTFQLVDAAAKYTVRIPARDATAEEFAKFYRIVA